MRKTKVLFIAALLLALTPLACKSKKTAPATVEQAPAGVASVNKIGCGTHLGYQSGIKTLVDKSCALTCHSSSKRAGGIELSSYESLKTEAAKPRFLGALKHEGAFSPMPKKAPKLSDTALAMIECWILNGSKP